MREKVRLFIVGCGRNGTSMCAGLFAGAGVFMGERLHGPSLANPKGYFEDPSINDLNNRILASHVPQQRVRHNGVQYLCDSPLGRHQWLARIPIDVDIAASPSELAEIETWTSRASFCFKDPRFCYVLHLWRATAPDARMICVFRNSSIAAQSILTNCQQHPPLFGFAISVDQAFELWTLTYRHVIEKHIRTGRWLFVHYDDLITGRAWPAIEKFTEVNIDASFPDRELNRATSVLPPPQQSSETFARLCELARSCY